MRVGRGVAAMQILRNLYQLGGDLNGLSHAGVDAGFEDANSYAVAGPEGVVLFDCGCGQTLDQLLDRLCYWGHAPESIRGCVLTHAHLDHAGGAHLLRARGIPVVAHAETAEAIAAGDERCAGFLYHKRFVPCATDRTLRDGEVFEIAGLEIEAMHVPGHSRGCTAYFFVHEGRRIVVSGDLIGTLGIGDFGWSGSIDFDKRTYIESLRRFARREMDVMLPGHGLVYFHAPRRRVEQVLNAALMQWR
jgi:glyoxylase-like metal-dependent hydrolase (beta-lactamase superfamily II)